MGNGMNKILPGLFVGNIRDAKDTEEIKNNKITHILSIHDNAKPVFPSIKYLCISASDTPDQSLMPYFRECSAFIHQARLNGGSVLVHCLAGVSRSVTVTVAYIMTATGHSYRHVLNAVRQARTVANPNFGFKTQLQKFQDHKFEEERAWFVENFGENPFDDYDVIQSLYDKYYEMEQLRQAPSKDGAPPIRASGSVSSSLPLNRQEDDSVSWTAEKRRGVFLDDDVTG